jgi:tetratricopeptide (TPR) repeat protein
MTMNTPTAVPVAGAVATTMAEPEQPPSRLGRNLLIALAVVVALFAGTFALAWWDGARLSASYMVDADRAYEAGEFLTALTGAEEFDATTNKYVTRGGYLLALRVWDHPFAWPRPAAVARAEQRIDEILQERLTIEDAEAYVQANVGKPNPYLGMVYLRLGELYEKEGDVRSAADIYEEVPELFPNNPELVERARANLERVGGG